MKRKYEPQTSFWNKKIWSHIELGAANYADNVNGDITYTSKKKISKNQFNILFMTTDELIKNKGKRGIIYINDLTEKMVAYTINRLKAYIIQKYPDSDIDLRPLVGDFFKIDIPMVTSIHLKNPEKWFFYALYGDEKNRLEYFANHSQEGLILVTYFTNLFLNQVDKLNVGYRVLKYDFCPYIHADGTDFSFEGNVLQFSIKSLSHLSGRLRSHSSTVDDRLIGTNNTNNSKSAESTSSPSPRV